MQLLPKVTVEVLEEAVERMYVDTGSTPKTISVSIETYSNLLRIMWTSSGTINYIPPRTGVEVLSLQTSCGSVDIVVDKKMPPHVDYYFDDNKEWTWQDQLFEDIILRGKYDEVDIDWRSAPKDI